MKKIFYDKYLMVLIIEIAWETALRISEILAIRVQDIDLLNSELFIPDPKGGISFTKGLNRKITRMLKFFLTIRPESASDSLLLSSNGKPISRKTFTQRFTRLRDRLKLPKRVSIHGARANFITRHLNAGKSLKQVSIAANHSDTKVTEHYFSCLTRDSIEAQKEWN